MTRGWVPRWYLATAHGPAACEGRGCWLHHPSDHHMKAWRIVWRADRAMPERLCPHGVGHPDPDHLAWLRSIDPDRAEGDGIHGCCGCCRPPAEGAP